MIFSILGVGNSVGATSDVGCIDGIESGCNEGCEDGSHIGWADGIVDG